MDVKFKFSDKSLYNIMKTITNRDQYYVNKIIRDFDVKRMSLTICFLSLFM